MKTESHSINDVLAKNATSFFIPPFQRSYAWGKSEIERFFYDVIRIIESELDDNQHDKLEHFFGTIVIKEEKSGFAHKSIIVDGQQRLTTTLIFLIALRDLEEDSSKRDYIIENYLTNNTSTFQDKIKLKQVTNDWESYRALINSSDILPGNISNAYHLFIKLLSNKAKTNRNINFENYITAISKMNVAVIFLDERPFKGEDPQIIFETLNSLGKPLTLSDLVRNFVLLNMKSSEQSEIYENVWHPQIEQILKDSTSDFFRDYLQYKTSSSIKVVSVNNTKEVYKIFKDFVNSSFKSHRDFINDIVRYTYWYKFIISGDNQKLKFKDMECKMKIEELVVNIFQDIRSEAFKSFVLGLLEYNQEGINGKNISDAKLCIILSIIRTYLIRRRILGLTQGENKNIVGLCKKIELLALGETQMINLLSNMIYRLRLPNDNEVRNELETMNFYNKVKKYSKFILGKIEQYNTKVSVDYRDKKITIEHIMPQSLSKSWQEEIGDNYEVIHQKYLHNIGNLILTEFNSEIGNKAFSVKKMKLNDSSLNFRLFIIKKTNWNEASILEHRNKMIESLLKTFPVPEEYKFSDNWNTRIIDKHEFSPLELNAGEFAEGNKPENIVIYGKNYAVNTWQKVFITFLKHFYEMDLKKFQFIKEDQYNLFSKKTAIVNWHALSKMIEKDDDITNRYKSFNFKVWSNVTNLNDDTIFIHINISASTCINRVASVMKKLNMEEETIQISLK